MLHRAGSSPLTRGKRQASCVDVLLIGLIPAHAGKTRHTLCPSSSGTAHPRSRGENSNAADRSTPAGGSSPLTRGKLVEGARLFDVVGLIPAHAGKTPLVSHRAISRPAHPRSRGENEYQVRKSVTVRGSSPLTRGKRDNDVSGRRQARLIPAHAGKTSSPPSWEPGRAAHPRSRGENFLIVNVERKVDGSSPLTRGKHQTDRVRIHSRGLIPAHAGKTQQWPQPSASGAAHPRSRGENGCH